MGKKHKATKLENNTGASVRMKRKISESTDESPTRKRAKDDSWFPGKFVLLNPKKNLNQQQNGKHQSESSTSAPEKPKKLNKKKKTKKKKFESSRRNQNAMNNEYSASSENSQKDDASILESFYNGELDSDSENYSEDDFESLSEEEECQEEWDTDTDYDGEEEEYDSMDYEDDCNEYYTDDEAEDAPYNSGDDSDYVPDIEDKFIKKGEAIFHDGKGLDLAFGDSTESKIIEIKDIHPALDDSMDNEDVPKLVTLNGDQEADDEDEDMGEETEKLIKELQIDDDEDDEKIIESSKLLKNATFFNCINEQGVFVILRETIHFHGILNIKSILNNVEINGYELTEGSELSSAISISHSSYFVNLSPVINTTSSKTIKTLKDELANYLTKDDIEDLIIKINLQSDVLLHLSEGFINTQMQMLMYYSPYTLLPSKKFILSNNICQSSELLLSSRFFVSDENRKLSAFAVSSQWNNLEMSSTSRFFIVGGKNVGKSTLSQFLINKNVTKFQKILLIDLDIGQPICQATQTVSATLISKPLIGSGFLNAITPSKSILYGDKNVMISPFKYVRCVRKLVDFCNTNRELKVNSFIIPKTL
jgi:polynucleotide 5'-hydroxyl-kinase GRC3/NOL9